jgi:anti-sigma-K factor RskA
MNIESYIRSGFLESYALGQGTPAERAEVERMVALYPEVAAELKAIEASLEAYAQAHAIAAPEGLKDKIMAQLTDANPASESDESTSPGSSVSGGGFNWLPWLLALVSAGLGFGWWQSNTAQRALSEQVATLTQQLSRCQSDSTEQLKVKQNMAFLNDSGTRRLDLKSETGQQVTIHYNSQRQSAVLNTAQLAALAPDQDYQLWIIVKDNPNPIPLEVFKPGTDPQALIPVTYKEQAVAYAVSVEPRGGTQTGKPTTVIMIGQTG